MHAWVGIDYNVITKIPDETNGDTSFEYHPPISIWNPTGVTIPRHKNEGNCAVLHNSPVDPQWQLVVSRKSNLFLFQHLKDPQYGSHLQCTFSAKKCEIHSALHLMLMASQVGKQVFNSLDNNVRTNIPRIELPLPTKFGNSL